MRDPQPAEYQFSIVMRGEFNPAIFQPAWLAAEKLIGKQEAESAKIDVIHRDVSMFSSDWLRLEITQDRFFAMTKQEQYTESLRDLVVGIFSLLSHTPLRVMGINLIAHIRVPSVEAWNEAGHRLAPKNLWEGILQEPGMVSLTMQESKRRDGRKGYIRVVVEPSSIVLPGLFFNANDHYIMEEDVKSSEVAVSILKEEGQHSLQMSEDIIYKLYERLLK